MSSVRACLSLAGGCLVLAGCVGTYHGHPEQRGPRNVESRTRQDVARPARWRQVFFGSPPKPTLMGYVKTDERDGLAGTSWVYDTDFVLVGYVSPSGDTVRLWRGREERVGGYDLRHALLRLWRYDKETVVDIQPMPAPRG